MRDPNPYKLLTPGPLTTTLSVREAMMIDRCTWDDDYKRMTEEIRAGLLDFAHAGDDYTVVLMLGRAPSASSPSSRAFRAQRTASSFS